MYEAINSLSDALGVEVIGAKLRQGMSQSEITQIQDLILEHQVVVFRDQEMTPEEQIAICG